MKKIACIFLGPAFVTLFFTAAVAQFAKPEDAIKYRRAVMTVIGNHFGRMASVVKGQQPYVRADFSNDAELVERLSKLPWEAFMVAGTAQGDTHLKPEALGEKTEFIQAGQKFETEITKLVSAANSDNFGATKGQFGEVAKSCQGCHRQFRSD